MTIPPDHFPLDRPLARDYEQALRGIAAPEFLKSIKYQEQQWRANRYGAHPDMLRFEHMLVRRMGKLGVPMFTHCLLRTHQEQQRVYDDGHSRAKPGQSAHNWGCAVDIVHGTKAWNMDKKAWSLIGHVGKELAVQIGVRVTWGGDWSFYDPAHWELSDWRGFNHQYPWSHGDELAVPKWMKTLRPVET